MAQHTHRRGPRTPPAATSPPGPGSGAPLRSVPDPPARLSGQRRVLLLNATYEPLTALPLRRAIVMLVCHKAETVHDDPAGVIVRSATTAVVVPSVIRLTRYVRVPYRARVPMTRAALMHRDRFRCAYCGNRADTVDHVVPRSRGGAHCWENCVACCSACNHRKADRLLAELGWTLRCPPVTPKGQHWRLLSAGSELDPCWSRYLGEGAA
ncbi:HNH endonuclease [Mycolicibacillus trivialis]|uniref:Endonuclease n=1 Tax=Mycolicibacillus trivialis TaxID=1798 RepID=A0A1X2EPL7_9MYCO|nr:HNH endonuclease [Mycolicibacillus trivialis]ORX07237.1 endonuclease [Mycolicibacillus trivialis]